MNINTVEAISSLVASKLAKLSAEVTATRVYSLKKNKVKTYTVISQDNLSLIMYTTYEDKFIAGIFLNKEPLEFIEVKELTTFQILMEEITGKECDIKNFII